MAVITSQWWRRLVNAYEMKAGMVYLQCKTSASQVSILPIQTMYFYLCAVILTVTMTSHYAPHPKHRNVPPS